MNTYKKNARIAGLLYLIMGITGVVGIMYVPSKIIVTGDIAATAINITNSELLIPQHKDIVSTIMQLPLVAAEIPIILWLLIIGAREMQPATG